MDNLLFLLIVLVPGAIIKGIVDEQIPSARRTKSQIEEIVEYLEYGVTVLLLSLAACYLKGVRFNTFSGFLASLNSIEFLLKYAALSIIVTTVVGNLLSLDCVINARLKLANWFRKREGRPSISEYNTVYDEIFFNRKWKIEYQVVEIIKSGSVVSRGVIVSYPQPKSGSKEIALGNTDEVNGFFLKDQAIADPNEKMFSKILTTYYDLDCDVLYKLYDSSKYKAMKIKETVLESEQSTAS